MKTVDFSVLKGKTIVGLDAMEKYGDKVLFVCSDGTRYAMYHQQDCCETVEIEDVAGEVSDLLNSPITLAEESTNNHNADWDSMTWTFYKLATVKGYVTIRWVGKSNGYYSESVDFVELEEKDKWEELC